MQPIFSFSKIKAIKFSQAFRKRYLLLHLWKRLKWNLFMISSWLNQNSKVFSVVWRQSCKLKASGSVIIFFSYDLWCIIVHYCNIIFEIVISERLHVYCRGYIKVLQLQWQSKVLTRQFGFLWWKLWKIGNNVCHLSSL